MIELNKIYNNDCLEIMKDIEDNSIDCIVTSPPYNKKGLAGKRKVGNNIWKSFNIDYLSYGDDMPEVEYRNWQIKFINECMRILKPTGSLFYNHKIRRFNNTAYFPTWVFDTSAKLYQMIVWDRGNCCDMRNDYLYPTTELIFWLTKGKPTVYKSQAMFTNEVWRIPPTRAKNHPATFPNDLVKNCILLTTRENDIVLDPFMGAGTTAVESIKLNRQYIGTEMDATYYNLCLDAINNATHKG